MAETPNSLNQHDIKLLYTPTSGVAGEHSPYYRRLISAGYKGFLQGTIGGATLYGVLGAAVGAVAALPLAALVGPVAFMAVPVLTGYGVLKGATTFGNIGSNAAQLAEYAEANERRRALLDRLSDATNPQEIAEIQRMIADEGREPRPTKMFHLKTVITCAVIGAVMIGGLAALGAAGLAGSGITSIISHMIGDSFVSGSLAATLGAGTVGTLAGAAVGAAGGAVIGLDRYYIRRWMDGAEGLLHDREKTLEMTTAREREVGKLSKISRTNSMAQTNVREVTEVPAIRAVKMLPAALEQAPSPVIQNVEKAERVIAAEPKLLHSAAV